MFYIRTLRISSLIVTIHTEGAEYVADGSGSEQNSREIRASLDFSYLGWAAEQ